MAVAVVNDYYAGGFGVLSITISAPTSGNALMVTIGTLTGDAALTAADVTDNASGGSNTYVMDDGPFERPNSGGVRFYFLRCTTPTGAPTQISIPGTFGYGVWGVEEVSGLDQTASPVDAALVTSAALGVDDSSPTQNITTTTDNAYIRAAVVCSWTGPVLTPSGGFVNNEPGVGHYDNFMYLADAGAAGVKTAAGTLDTGTLWRVGAVAYKADAGVAITTPPIYGQLGYGPLGSGVVGMAWAGQKVPAGGAYTLTAAAGSYTLTGVAAAIQRSRIVPAAAGSYTLTGVAAAIKRSRLLTAAAGAYTLTGNIALVLRNKVVSAAAGSYALTGQAATITYTPLIGGYTLVANTGTYTLSGQAATITRSRVLPAAAGSYALTGQPATILRNKVLPAAAGAYALTGQAATILKSKVLPAAAGSYALTGVAALIKRNRVLPAAAGAYNLTGQAATIIYTPLAGAYTLVAATGSYTLNGQAATITYSGGSSATGEGDNWRRRRRPAAHVRG